MSDSVDQSNTAVAGSIANDATISTATPPPTTTATTRIASPPSSGNAAVAASAAASASATMTITEQAPPQTQTLNEQVLRLTLQDRIGVQWEDDVVDNEGMGRKSSKRCCIFHKPRAFGESSTDTSDYDSDNENGKYSGHHHKKIAHKKGNQKIPDHLKWHA